MLCSNILIFRKAFLFFCLLVLTPAKSLAQHAVQSLDQFYIQEEELIPLNAISKMEMQQFDFLNDKLINAFFEYKKKHGPFRNKYQLQTIPFWNISTCIKLAALTSLSIDNSDLDQKPKRISSWTRFKYNKLKDMSEHQLYIRSRSYGTIRGKWQYGFDIEKDYDGATYEGIHGHLQKRFKNLLFSLGDHQVQYHDALSFSSRQRLRSYSTGPDGLYWIKKSQGPTAFTSTKSQYAARGFQLAYQKSNYHLNLLYTPQQKTSALNQIKKRPNEQALYLFNSFLFRKYQFKNHVYLRNFDRPIIDNRGFNLIDIGGEILRKQGPVFLAIQYNMQLENKSWGIATTGIWAISRRIAVGLRIQLNHGLYDLQFFKPLKDFFIFRMQYYQRKRYKYLVDVYAVKESFLSFNQFDQNKIKVRQSFEWGSIRNQRLRLTVRTGVGVDRIKNSIALDGLIKKYNYDMKAHIIFQNGWFWSTVVGLKWKAFKLNISIQEYNIPAYDDRVYFRSPSLFREQVFSAFSSKGSTKSILMKYKMNRFSTLQIRSALRCKTDTNERGYNNQYRCTPEFSAQLYLNL